MVGVSRYVVRLVNFGYTIGIFDEIGEAIDKAEDAGFEATIQVYDVSGGINAGIMNYSPIGGWSMTRWNAVGGQ